MLSQLFFTIDFAFSIAVSAIGLIFSLIMIGIIAARRQCRTITNLTTCNMIVFVAAYCICSIVSSMIGFREDWALRQFGCVFRAFCYLMIPASISYSYLIQAVSRLFFTVLCKHKYLATYRVHWCLIASNWIIGVLVSIVPFFFDATFVYEEESRLCVLTSKNFPISIYAISIAFVIPLNSSMVIYNVIFHHARRSSRRIAPSTSNTPVNHMPNARREMKLAQNMIMIETLYVGAGAPLLILIFWHVIQPGSAPPESLYLLSFNSISLFATLMVIMLFSTNKQVRETALKYLHVEQRQQRMHLLMLSRNQQQISQATRH